MLFVFQLLSPLPHVACVLFMYPNHLILRWVINESVRIQKKKKKSPKQHTTEAGKKDRGDANQKIGLFTAKEMKACIKEIKEVQRKAKDQGKKPEFSQNEICDKHGISPSSVSKRVTGKVKGYEPQLDGARKGKILFQRHVQVT